MSTILARYGLAFAEPEDERRFVRSFAADDLRSRQKTMLVGALIYYGFAFWDGAIDPAHASQSHLIRLPVVVLVMLPLTALLFVRRAQDYVEAILLVYSVISVSVLSLIYAIIDYAHGYVACIITATLFVSTLLTMWLT